MTEEASSSFDLSRFRARLEARCADASRPIIFLAAVDSTSSELRRRLSRGELGHGAVVVAERQLEGRGRLGRSWQSDTPGNLYLSVAVGLSEPLPQSCVRLPLVAGLAAASALLELAPSLEVGLRLKWPNDLLITGKKVGGILCELVTGRSPAIVGLGLNLGPTFFQGSLASTAATLSDHLHSPLLPEDVGADFISELENKLAFFQSMPMSCLVENWTLKAEPFGRRVRVGALEGMTQGLDSQGRLLLRSEAGDLIPVVGGVVEETAS